MQKLSHLVAVIGSLAAVHCSSGSAPYGGPPPEYEPAKPFPTGSAVAPAPAADAQAAPPYGTPEDLAKSVDAYMAGFGSKWGDAYAPSGVLLIAREGKPVVARTYGKADREAGTPFSIDTRLRIGSLTKQFTAATVMKLVEGGKLSTTDSVRKWVKELPQSFEPVTLHHLLGQTSGIPSYTDDLAVLERKGQDIPQTEILGWIARKAPDLKPGTRFNYSNSNYYLLSVVVERATKKPLAKVLADSLLAPASMTATGLDASSSATGYMRGPTGKLTKADFVHDSLPLGAGYLRSSARDLVLWDRALAGQTVLSAASKETLFSHGAKCAECGGADYGYGWIIDRVAGKEVEWHNGSVDGFNSFFARAPEQGIAVVLLSNTMQFDTTTAGRAIVEMTLSGTAKAPIVERDLAPLEETFAKSLVGDYVLAKDSREDLESKLPKPVLESIEAMDIAWKDGALSFKPVGQGRMGLRKAADGPLFNGDVAVDLVPTFAPEVGQQHREDPKKPQKKASGLILKQGQLTATYVRGKLPPKKAPKKTKASAPKP